MTYILPFSEIRNTDGASVGGKNASLGEMFNVLAPSGIRVPDGFAITASAWHLFLDANGLIAKLAQSLGKLDKSSLANLAAVGAECRALIAAGQLPLAIKRDVLAAYARLNPQGTPAVAVRSSATVTALPTANFAGLHESFVNVRGADNLLAAVRNCYISLFHDRAIKYRSDHGIEHLQVALSVGVQHMVRADTGSAGVAFTLDPVSGNSNLVAIAGAWGLGANVVQGAVDPDEFLVFKNAVGRYPRTLIHRKLGAKANKLIYAGDGPRPIVNVETSMMERATFALTDADVQTLGEWCCRLELHYGLPLDIEWAKDGTSGELFILQARPETVHGRKQAPTVKEYLLETRAQPLCTGKAVGRAIASGRVCIVAAPADAHKVRDGDIIVTDSTNPDWNALLHKAVGIVTNQGGRTSHAALVARELGIPAVVGTGHATAQLRDGQIITITCCDGEEGHIYDGKLDWQEKALSLDPGTPTRTKPLLILADPARALNLARYPAQGVGLLRMEFIISNTVRVHPMALVQYDSLPNGQDKHAIAALTQGYRDKKRYFVETLAESIALVAAAFHPREVIVRMSDFKTNEYAQLLGGRTFEPEETCPMLGLRGAARYCHPRYREGFGLECEAMRIVRDEMGLTNVKLMIPFCRTVKEGRQVLETMADFGLVRGKNGLEVYVMAELPSNVILAREFANIFDGFSIGSNDLTQLTLGVDRDSPLVSDLFSENNPAVLTLLTMIITDAHEAGVKIGLCGQAPSDFPEFAQYLVQAGIDSIAFTADALLTGLENIRAAEMKIPTLT